MPDDLVCTPTIERCVTSYPVRRAYAPGVVFPPEISTVKDVIDIHCHAHQGQQDALALAKFASQSGMGGLLFKTIVSWDHPAADVAKVKDALNRWADRERVQPIQCWAGALLAPKKDPITIAMAERQLDEGVIALWLPVFNHANTYNRVGGRLIWWDDAADPKAHSEPLPWEEALDRGHYLLDDKGRLKQVAKDVVKLCADRGAALFFGHATHAEIYALADEVARTGLRRAVIDHPYSPFINLTIAQMKELAKVGIILNFTFDELSPLLGVDPAKMYAAIRAIGPEHCALSSDAGEPLFPHSVECMRLVCGYMEAFGLTKDELRRVSVENPRMVVGLN